MKKILFPALVLVAFVVYSFKGGEAYKTLEIGQKAPKVDYKMQSTKGKDMSLESIQKSNGALVVFSCNTCPFVIAWEDRYPGLAKLASETEVGFVLVNSNEAKRSGDDSIEEMKKHAKESGYGDVNYVVDNNSELANAFGAKTTPHVFLFDKNWKLVYEGAIDDNYKSSEMVEKTYLNNAIENLKNGKKIDPSNTKAMGCSIKRVKS